MRKIAAIVLCILAAMPAFSQTTKETRNKEVLSRSGDHLMIQMSYDSWTGVPDSIKSHMGGFNRGANVYVMYDMPFKANPTFSVAGGIGIGTSNIFFKKMTVDIASTNPVLPFTATDTVNNFKKYKLSTTFLEIPVELRFSSNPITPNKSVKAAIGIKLGTMLNAHTKGKILRDPSGKTLVAYTEKNSTKAYFNTTRLAATARVGYGNFTVFGAYNLTSMFKSGVAADVKLLQVGLTISGL